MAAPPADGVSLLSVLDEVSDRLRLLSQGPTPDPRITGVALVEIPADLERVSPGQLVLLLCPEQWVGRADQLARALAGSGVAAVVVREGVAPEEFLRALRCAATACDLPVLTVAVALGWTEVLRDLQDFLHGPKPEPAGSVARSLMQADTLGEIADVLSRMIGKAVTIEDRNFVVLSHSAQTAAVDRARVETILRKQVPPEVISELRTCGVLERLATCTRPMMVPAIPEVGLGPRVVMPLHLGDELLGHIWVIDHQGPLPERELPLLEQAATRAVSILSRDRQAAHLRRRRNDVFLHDLLLGRIRSEEEAGLRLQMLGYSLAPVRVVLVLAALPARRPQPRSERGERPLALQSHCQSLLSLLEAAGTRLNGQAIVSALDNGVWALCAFPETSSPRGWRKQVEALLQSLLPGGAVPRELTITAGVGMPFSALPGASTSFQQSRQALAWGLALRPVPPVTFSADLGALRLVQMPSTEDLKDTAGCSLSLLDEYDQAKGAELLRSLEVFLDEAGNVRRAAARLHVHPNSLLYRLHRIETEAGLSLEDGVTRLLLHLELKVRRMARGGIWAP